MFNVFSFWFFAHVVFPPSLVVDPVVNFFLCHCFEVGDRFEFLFNFLVGLGVVFVFVVFRVYLRHHDVLTEPVRFSFCALTLSGIVAACLYLLLFFFSCFFWCVCCILFDCGFLPRSVFFFVGRAVEDFFLLLFAFLFW